MEEKEASPPPTNVRLATIVRRVFRYHAHLAHILDWCRPPPLLCVVIAQEVWVVDNLIDFQ